MHLNALRFEYCEHPEIPNPKTYQEKIFRGIRQFFAVADFAAGHSSSGIETTLFSPSESVLISMAMSEQPALGGKVGRPCIHLVRPTY